MDDETIDVLSRIERQVSKVNEIVCRPKKLKKQQTKLKLDYNSDNQKLEKKFSDDQRESEQPVCQSEQNSRQSRRAKSKPPVANPKSADLYMHKAKAKMLAQVPTYKPIVGMGGLGHSDISDRDDVSTRVSSKSQAQRNYKYQKANVADYYAVPSHESVQTPSHLNVKLLEPVSRRHEPSKYEVSTAGSQRQEALPHLKPYGRLNSVDLDRMEKEQKLAAYLAPNQPQQIA